MQGVTSLIRPRPGDSQTPEHDGQAVRLEISSHTAFAWSRARSAASTSPTRVTTAAGDYTATIGIRSAAGDTLVTAIERPTGGTELRMMWAPSHSQV
jgi:hypothetical protein